jgi:hypothetical protein
LSAPRLEREVEEMAEHFPRWLLTLCRVNEPAHCRACGGLLVFDRGLRCVVCDRPVETAPADARLGWFGLMPPIGLDGLPRVRDAVAAKAPHHHVVGRRDDLGTFLLVPLVLTYPDGFPHQPPDVAYLPGFFSIRGMPRPAPSHEVHLLSSGIMCLFASGQWRSDSTAREVLQQRAYAHVIKMLNYGNGKRNAFAMVS